MATGASTADVAIILIDARKGILQQTKRHSYIVSTVGVRNVILAVNKLDLVNYSEEVYQNVVSDYMEFSRTSLNLDNVIPIPISALRGDNVLERSPETPWFKCETLIESLESIDISGERTSSSFRMPIQWVNRPNSNFRGFAGQIGSGLLSVGDQIKILPSDIETSIERIVTFDGDVESASAGSSITVTLADEVDASRGAILVSHDSPCDISDQFQAKILWMGNQKMIPGREYIFKSNVQKTIMTITRLKHTLDMNSMEERAAEYLAMNEIGVCTISLNQKIAYENYNADPLMGGFIIIDKINFNTVGMGFIDYSLRRSSNITWQDMDLTKEIRGGQKSQKPLIIWFTGLSGSGKSSIANILEKKLHSIGKHTITLDGDNIRHGLSRDLGFTEEDRVENIRRIAETAKLMLEAGLICITSFISPFASERGWSRSLFESHEFIEVFVDTPIEVCEERDPKGLYKKARNGALPNFTGISSPYEPPVAPEIRLDTQDLTAEESADIIIRYLLDKS